MELERLRNNVQISETATVFIKTENLDKCNSIIQNVEKEGIS